MIVILLIAILLFGANKIPKLARSTGEAMGEFKKGRQEVEEELEELQEGTSAEEGVLGEESSTSEGSASSGSSSSAAASETSDGSETETTSN
jgi:sec-independent protein translocase protein TatA